MILQANILIHSLCSASPFLEKTMFATPAQFAEVQKGQFDAMFAASHAVFGATEKLIELNLAAAKAVMDESAEKAQAFLGVKDVQELLALSGGFAQPTLEKATSYGRQVYGIAAGTGAELTKIVEAQIADGNKKITEMVEFAAKSAPVGSEPAVSMFKSAVAAANTAYDTFTKASKQAVEMAESNIAAATSATMKAAAAANDAAKAKSKKVA
jgi:phasin family protein